MRYTPEEKVYSMITKIEANLHDLKASLAKAFKAPKETEIKTKENLKSKKRGPKPKSKK